MKKKRFTAAQLITIHRKVLADTAYNERERRQRLSDALRYFDVIDYIDKKNVDEWWFGKNDEVYEGEFSVKSA